MAKKEIWEAFKDARFRAEVPEGGWPDEFWVLTACNPNGVTISDAENEELTKKLELALRKDGKRIFPVTGFDRRSDHQEAGFGVVCGKTEILALGRAWDQLAVFHVKGRKVWLLSCASDGKETYLRLLSEMLEGMPCPFCGEGMDRGSAGLKYTLGGFLWAGWSSLTLFFSRTGEKRIPVVTPGRAVGALFCESCGTTILQGRRSVETSLSKVRGSGATRRAGLQGM